MIKKLIAILMIVGFMLSSVPSFALGQPDDVNDYRVKRQQVERLRRYILYELGHNPKWMHSQEQVKKVFNVVMQMDITIIQLYLQEQDEREAKQQEQEYKSLRAVNKK